MKKLRCYAWEGFEMNSHITCFVLMGVFMEFYSVLQVSFKHELIKQHPVK